MSKIFKLANTEIFMFAYGISTIFENDSYTAGLVTAFIIPFNVSTVRLHFFITVEADIFVKDLILLFSFAVKINEFKSVTKF